MQVDLQDVLGVLHLYCLSLAGTDVQIVDSSVSSTQAIAPVIRLPSVTARYCNRQDNYEWLKVMATHQVAHLEFGGAGVVYVLSRAERPRLAHDLYNVLEEGRLDARLARHYPGLRLILRRAQAEALDSRRGLEGASPVTAVLELLVRKGLGGQEDQPVPRGCETILGRLGETVHALRDPLATSRDAAEAAVRACDALSDLLEESGWVYETPDPVAYRGACQAPFIRFGDQGEQPEMVPPESSEEPETLPLEVSVNVNLASDNTRQGQQSGAPTLPQFLQHLADPPAASSPSPGSDSAPHDDDSAENGLQPLEPGTFVYDEWDYQSGVYRPRWCLVKEHVLDEGDLDCFDDALRRHSAVLEEVKHQFEAILPEGLGRITRLTDGEDLDLNAALEALADLRMRVPPDDKIYWRRYKVRRDVAVVFLLDMSASTAETLSIEGPGPPLPGARGPRGAAGRSKRRIIDLEKDSIALLMQALDAIGDAYGIYGFSGYGREGVDFYVVKDLAERFDSRIKRRLDRVTPRHATRMGAAIRHAVRKLAPHPAATKILLLLSDGRPQDRGYSRQGTRKAYAVHDTHMALTESRAQGITPFCLTVDKTGHDYLQAMCGDIGYEVLDDIATLPARLPMLYRALTT